MCFSLNAQTNKISKSCNCRNVSTGSELVGLFATKSHHSTGMVGKCADFCALAPQFVVDSLVAAVVEVVVDVDDVGEGVVALRGLLNAFVQAVSDHLRTRERFV